jgi:hypothetical protein
MSTKQLSSFLIGLALVLQIYSLFYGLHIPILEEHSFRQSQTAFSVWSLLNGSSWINYETPVLGPPWSIPFEFPLYQWVVALLVKIFSSPLEETGRVVSRCFYLLAVFGMDRILQIFSWDKTERKIAAAFLLITPIYLFWSRAFMIEATALAMCVLYIWAMLSWERSRTTKKYIWAIIFAWFAATTKATTFFSFGMGLFFFYLHKNKFSRAKWGKITELPMLILLFWFFAIGWSAYTDLIKSQNPLADFIQSKQLTAWNFGIFSDRFSKDFWYMLFRQSLHDAGGHRTAWILLTIAAFFKKNI